ncbi:hypothetical protein MTO96_006219 [Rhipicephalus appendiculatus]
MEITGYSRRTSRASSKKPTVLTARKGAAGSSATGQPTLVNLPEVYCRPCTRSQVERFFSQVRYQEQVAKRSVSIKRQRCQARSMPRGLKNAGAGVQKRTMVSGASQKKVAAARLDQTLGERAKFTGSSKHPSKASSRKPTILAARKGAAGRAAAAQSKLVNLPEVYSRPCTRSQVERFFSRVRYQEQVAKRSVSIKRQLCQARSMPRDLKNVGAGVQKRTMVSGASQKKVAAVRLDQTLRERAKFTGSSKNPSKASSRKPTILTARKGAAGRAAAAQSKLVNLPEVYSRPCTRSQVERFYNRVSYQEQLAKRHESIPRQRCQARSMLSDLKDACVGGQKRTMIFSAFRSEAEVGRLDPKLPGRAKNINGQSKCPSKASRKPSISSSGRGAASKTASRYPKRVNLQSVCSAPCTRSRTACLATQVTCHEQLAKRSVQQQRCTDRSMLKSSKDVRAEGHERRRFLDALQKKAQVSDPMFRGRATKIASCSKKPPMDSFKETDDGVK